MCICIYTRIMIVMTKSIRIYTGLSSLCLFMQKGLPGKKKSDNVILRALIA